MAITKIDAATETFDGFARVIVFPDVDPADFTDATTLADVLKDGKDLGQIVEDSPSWDGDEADVEVLKDDPRHFRLELSCRFDFCRDERSYRRRKVDRYNRRRRRRCDDRRRQEDYRSEPRRHDEALPHRRSEQDQEPPYAVPQGIRERFTRL